MRLVAAGVVAAAAFCWSTQLALAALMISTAPTSNVTCSAGVCTATASTAVLNVGDLQIMLASSSVKVVSGSVARDIEIAAALTWASSNGLTLDAHSNITIDQPVSVAGPGGFTLLTRDGGHYGGLLFDPTGNVTFLGLSNPLSINGHAYTLVNSIASLAGAIAANPSGYFALANSYDASHDGTYSHSPINRRFDGAFEGLGNTISNLTITSHSIPKLGLGLFSSVERHGIIRDVGVTNVSVTARVPENTSSGNYYYYEGALAGVNDGYTIGCFSAGNVDLVAAAKSNFAAVYVGGLVGSNNAVIVRSSAATALSVKGEGPTGSYVYIAGGGLVGFNQGKIESSSTSGTVTDDLDQNEEAEGLEVGGMIGDNDSFVENSHSSAAVSISTGFYAEGGGLVGENDGWILNSYAAGPVSGGKTIIGGGLVGGQGPTGLINGTFATGS